MVCPRCGKNSIDGVTNCTHCGYLLTYMQSVNNYQDAKTIALWDDEPETIPTKKSNKLVIITLAIVITVVILAVVLIIAFAKSSSAEKEIILSTTESTTQRTIQFSETDIGLALLSDNWFDLTSYCINTEVSNHFNFKESGEVKIQIRRGKNTYSDEDGKIISYSNSYANIKLNSGERITIKTIPDSELVMYEYDVKDNKAPGVLIKESVYNSDSKTSSDEVRKKLENTYWASDYFKNDIIHFTKSDKKQTLTANIQKSMECINADGVTLTSKTGLINFVDGKYEYYIILEFTSNDSKMNAFIQKREKTDTNTYKVEHEKEQWTKTSN